ncbi:hypothetical protein C8Q70DRAFT_1046746 [Cubamyces menziesii]|nr:hypothetical protein C8Q70DRAFT_1046746 [Cubamyces menziesii]
MLYYDEPQLELTLDAADGSYLKYSIPDLREVKPGVLATGQWTLNHPFVDAYLTALARLAPKQRPHQGPGASVPSTATTSPVSVSQPLPDTLATSPALYPTPAYALQNEVEKLRWRAHHGGIASVYTVAQVITVQLELFPGPGSAWYAAEVARLSEEQKRAVFALAALKVLNHPTHPAHWALWAKNVLRRTAQVVEEVFQLKPCPIVSHVGWLGLPEGIWALEGLQSTFIPPPPPQPEKPKAGGMTLRKRKVPNATTSSSSTAASLTTPAEEEVALRVSPRKRQRTTRAQAALQQAQEEQEAAAAAALAATAAAVEAAEAEATAEVPTAMAEENLSSMLLDVPPPRANSNSRDSSKAVKQELLDVDGASSALQPLGLALAVPDTAPAVAAHDVPVSGPAQTTASAAESVASASPRSRSAASMSPSATRRSTRARRKPAQGPVQLSSSSLSSVSTASTPLSALSTPETSPAPLNERALDDPENADGKQQQQRARAGSCGSSTAVSEAGEASEGTVVDLDGDAAGPKKFGKRKAAEMEAESVDVDVDALVEHAQSAIAPPSSDITATGPVNATAAAPSAKSRSRKSRAKSGGGAARSKKRVKIDTSAATAATVPEASGEENVPPATAPAPAPSRPAKKSKASAGSRARA